MSAEIVAQYLRDFSKRTGTPADCDLVCLERFRLTGDLDLASRGLEGTPLLGLELVDCDIEGGLLLEYAYMKSLSFCASNQKSVALSFIKARGVTVLDSLKLGRVQMPSDGRVDFSEARLKGGLQMSGMGVAPPGFGGFQAVSLASAIVGGDLVLEGVRVRATGERAFDGEELQVEGTIRFGCLAGTLPSEAQPCDFTGQLHLRGAKIGGQLLFEGLQLAAHKRSEDPVLATNQISEGRKPVLALMAEDAEIGGDVFFREHRKSPALGCHVEGQIDIAGLRVGGEVHVFGIYDATDFRIRAFRAQRVHIGGDLRFGWLPGFADGTHGCSVRGECDFSEATVLGKVLFSGSTHEISTRYHRPPGIQRKRKQAIDLKGARISGDLRLESGGTSADPKSQRLCTIAGIAITGATIGGRLLVNGVIIKGDDSEGVKQKAISANGTTIRGGIFVNVAEAIETPSILDGDVRLRNATVDGPVVFSGVDMTAGMSGVAIWASNTHFGSDVILNPVGKRQPRIRGELRLRGAHIRGHLWIQGLNIQAGDTGAAIDCFTAEVEKTFALGSYCPTRVHRKGDSVCCTVKGIVSLAHLHAQSLTIGASPLALVEDPDDMLFLTGTILIREIKLQAAALFANAELRPGEELDDKEGREHVLRQLKRWGVYRPSCIIYANYAILGSRLFVRLAEKSRGLVSLYGATTGTIGAYSGSAEVDGIMDSQGPTKMERWRAWWGSGGIKQPSSNKLRENWGKPLPPRSPRWRGAPQPHELAKETIVLNIDEFSYTRTNDFWEKILPRQCDPISIGFWLLGRPTPSQLGPRYEFIQRIVENPGSPEPIVISAHRQLAKVYRDMGYLELSYRYTRERRWLQIRFGKTNLLQKFVDVVYSTLFGFGYGPIRAIITVALLFCFSLGFVHKAGKGVLSRDGANHACKGDFCNPSADANLSSCHLPDDAFNQWTEAAKLIIPFTRFEANSTCALKADAPEPLRLYLASIHVLSWILLPFAAATLTGVLREST